jgi:polysaccharide biosynthesis protein PelD
VPADPGFFKAVLNPYLALCLIAAAYYGAFSGFWSAGLAVLASLFPPPGVATSPESWRAALETGTILLPLALVSVFLFGIIRAALVNEVHKARQLARSLTMQNAGLTKKVQAVVEVNRELEERVLRQHESITALHTQVQAMRSQNLPRTLNVLLDTVQKFSWATKASVFRFQGESGSLAMIANLGWLPEDGMFAILDPDASIEGWVYRNNIAFSMRMLTDHEDLRSLDPRRNILTFPIRTGKSVWGVLNIEELPFSKYNLYTEKILGMLVELAAPSIERAVDYENSVRYSDLNPLTGLPGFLRFRELIGREVEQTPDGRHTFAIFILEIRNLSVLIETFGEARAHRLIMRLIEGLADLSRSAVEAFHYLNENQFALFHPGLDRDGAAFYTLQCLGFINGRRWDVDRTPAVMDVIIGQACFSSRDLRPDELLQLAENMLEAQKV